MWIIYILLTCFISVARKTHCQSDGSFPTAHIRNGTVIGRYLPSFNQDLFLGVPFANAPRLANPTPLTQAWHSPLPATSYGPICYGFGSNALLNLTQSEDCLNLNIIRPAACDPDAKVPVLLWLYGGGWRQGGSADPLFNLSYVVQTSMENGQPIMAISANYRLSFLGFPGGNESQAAGITNLGLKDQRMALHWLQENVAAFGGDPRKVTIWGESAGAFSVAQHLIAYGGTGGEELFRGALMASGFETGLSFSSASATQAGYDKIVASANCTDAADTLACLRAAPLEAIYSVEDTTGSAWWPVIDGDFIRRRPAAELAAGHVTRVPILLGSNSDEGFFVVNALGFAPNSTATLTGLLARALPALNSTIINAILTAYPEGGPAPPYSLPPDYPWCAALAAANLSCGSEYRRTAAILGDYFVTAPRRYMASEWARLGLPAYSYRFDTDPTAIPIAFWHGLGPGFATHGADVPYEFGLPGGFTTSIDFYPPVKDVPTHRYLSHVMVSKWVAFAHSGDPNAVTGECRAPATGSVIADFSRQSSMLRTGRHTVNPRPIWSSMRQTRR